MESKRGISLVVLVITIIVTVIITTLTIVQIDNVVVEVNKDEFAVEVTTIEDKIQEYYLLMGSLPVKTNEQYTVDELKTKLIDTTSQGLLSNEITANGDMSNVFYVVDLERLAVETNERGLGKDATDIYVVASNTLNVYYLKGWNIDGQLYFSAVLLISKNEVKNDVQAEQGTITLEEDLNLIKNTNVWTNEITITVKSTLNSDEQLQYSIGGATAKLVSDNKVITISADNMTDDEKTTFSTNKIVTVNKLKGSTVIASEEVSIANLDIEVPVLGVIESVDAANTEYNVVNISTTDTGGSGIKAVYYDIDNILVDNVVTKHYIDRTTVTVKDLLNFGKNTTNNSIKLDKNVKSIVAIAIDNAGNISDITTYTIDDTYLKSN